MILLSKLPAQYAKFIAALVGDLVAYLQLYGASWHLVPAFVFIGAALGVMGVPNVPSAPAPAPAPPPPATPGPV